MNIRVLFEIMYSTDSNSVIINSSYVSLYKLKQIPFVFLGSGFSKIASSHEQNFLNSLLFLKNIFHPPSALQCRRPFNIRLTSIAVLKQYQVKTIVILFSLTSQKYLSLFIFSHLYYTQNIFLR